MLLVRVIKRVLHDLAEFEKNPIPGISLCMPDKTNPSILHGNLVITQGPYKGILLHLIFKIPENYPLEPPQANLAPGLDFDQKYHHHVYEDQYSGNSICTDLTSNFAGSFNLKDHRGNFVQSGWTPGYTLSTLLTHLQIFFADPDYGHHFVVSKKLLDNLWTHIRSFKYDVTVTDGTTSEVFTHSYDSPYPPILGFKKIAETKPKAILTEEECKNSGSPVTGSTTADLSPKSLPENAPQEPVVSAWDKPLKKVAKKPAVQAGPVQNQSKNVKKSVVIKKEEISNKLICSISKTNIFDSSEIILGYPIDINQNTKSGSTLPTPIAEILSFEAHQANLAKIPQSDPDSLKEKLQTGAGASYKYWLPLYLDEAHFERGKEHILSAITSIFKSAFDPNATTFAPAMILIVFPSLLSRMVNNSIKNAGTQTATLIETYFQFFRLFVKLLDIYPELQDSVDNDIEQFMVHDNSRHKLTYPDLGEFLILLAVSSRGIDAFDVTNLAFKEHLARQVFRALKEDKSLGFKAKGANFVDRFMKATKTANKLFLAQYETIKLCLDQKVQVELAGHFGLIQEAKAEHLAKKLKRCQEVSVESWKTLIERLGLQIYVPMEEVMQKYIEKVYVLAKTQNYIK